MKKQSRRGVRERWCVMIAEDNDDHAVLIEMALARATRLPVDVHRARSGDEAVRLLESLAPDLILLDLKMPGRSGHEVLETIKGDEALRRIPVAVLTSSDRDEDVAMSYGLGGNHFLTKPEDPAQLESRLRSLLKNVDELSGIRRGAGGLDATAVSALDPTSRIARTVSVWIGVAVAVTFLVALAWSLGLLG